MKDRTFTDEEIIKALRCCASYDCDGCPLYSPTINCVILLPQKGLELVERYRAEIESLKKVLNELKMETEMVYKQRDAQKKRADSIAKFARADAINELAEAVKMEFYREFDEIIPSIMADKIDNLAREMTEDQK